MRISVYPERTMEHYRFLQIWFHNENHTAGLMSERKLQPIMIREVRPLSDLKNSATISL